MYYKYDIVLDARKDAFLAEATALLDKGAQFAVAHLTRSQMRDCMALAQEYDFTCKVLDPAVTDANFPEVTPEYLGFVHRDPSRRI